MADNKRKETIEYLKKVRETRDKALRATKSIGIIPNNVYGKLGIANPPTARIIQDDEEIVCCPKCLRLDSKNTTNRLTRKQRRSKRYKGVHENAYCVWCNKRMVYMKWGERLEKMIKKGGTPA